MAGLKFFEFSADNEVRIREAVSLRAYVWNRETGRETFQSGQWFDSHDSHAYHWAVLNAQNKLVASARLCIHSEVREFPDYDDIKHLHFQPPESPMAFMTRLVVHPDYQGMGIAHHLISLRVQKALSLGCRIILCEITTTRRATYERMGFEYIAPTNDATSIHEAGIYFHLYAKPLPSKANQSPYCIPAPLSISRRKIA